MEYRSWLRQMSWAGIDGDEATVLLPTRFLRDWVRTHYGEKITSLWQQENPAIRRVDIRVGKGRPGEDGTVEECRGTGLAESLAPAPSPPPVIPIITRQQANGSNRVVEELSAPLDPRFTFDSLSLENLTNLPMPAR